MYVSADQLAPPNASWLVDQWHLARSKSVRLLILDEVQKITRWSEAVKMLWEEDALTQKPFHVLLLGSSSLLMQKGMSESLAGRFELTRCSHWSWSECQRAFRWDLKRWLFFGGYPGLVDVVGDEPRWRSIVLDTMIETVLSRDILQLQTVTKPALLRQLFRLVCQSPAHIVSYENMLGQLQEAGNTTTLAHYLQLLNSAFLCGGLSRFSRGATREKASSPKLIVHNNALISALNPYAYSDPNCGMMGEKRETARDPERAQQRAAWFGRLVENAVGATLADFAEPRGWSLNYWRERQNEVDYVLQAGPNLFAIEVKSAEGQPARGLRPFLRKYPQALGVTVGAKQFPIEDFFQATPDQLIVQLLCDGLSNRLGARVSARNDYSFIAFTNESNHKSASFPLYEADASRLLKHLQD
jgi:predicted AAA+ superfamily ATPase